MLSPADVAERLLEMGQTLRKLHVRGLKPAEYRSCLPDPIRTPEELFGAVRMRIGELEEYYKTQRIQVSQERLTREAYDMEKPFPDPPSAAEITRMDEAIQWIGFVTARQERLERRIRLVMWLKSLGYRTGRISKQLGVSRETVRVWWLSGCETISRAIRQRIAA